MFLQVRSQAAAPNPDDAPEHPRCRDELRRLCVEDLDRFISADPVERQGALPQFGLVRSG